jgi:MscS family membrane protein
MPSFPSAVPAFVPALALAAAGRPFIERHLPAPLLAEGPRGLLWWQWLALPVVIVVALVAGAALGWATRRVLGHLAARTQTRWDDELLARLRGPLAMLWTIGAFTALRPGLDLDAEATAVISHVLRAATYFVFFWGGFRSLDLAFEAAAAAPWTKVNASLAGLLPMGRKMAKIVLLAIGLVSVLDSLGFQVASLIAGLGIGGVALALAAQKTVENLFGSVAIGVDQPFRVGDFVKVEDVVGTVESIGMRSTRIRTLDRTLVTLPNGKLADSKAETYAVRDRLRILVNLGLDHGTSAAQVRAVLAGIEAALRAHPRIWPEGTSVRLTEVREWSLNVEVMAWLQLTDWSAFTAERQELLLRFLAVVEEAGASLAFPTRTVRLVPEGGGGAGTRK